MSEPKKDADNPAVHIGSIGPFEISGGQNLNGQNNITGGVHQNVGASEQPTITEIYDAIRKVIPKGDTDTLAAVNFLEKEETAHGGETKNQPPNEGVVRSQTILARYRDVIVVALKEMGLLWLRAAIPQVVFVEPLIRMAIDALMAE